MADDDQVKPSTAQDYNGRRNKSSCRNSDGYRDSDDIKVMSKSLNQKSTLGQFNDLYLEVPGQS